MSVDLDAATKEIDQGRPKPLYLLLGEEYLVRRGAELLVERLVPNPAVGLNLITLDGASPREIAGELATLPLFPGPKVVLVRDPEFLAPKKGRGDPLSRAKEAWKAGRKKEAARRVLALAARAGWSTPDLDPTRQGAPSVEAWKEELGVELADQDVAFLREVQELCREEKLVAADGDVAPLQELLKKGAPPGHSLVVVASSVDSKHPLIRQAEEHGRVIERKVAGKLKEIDLSDLLRDVLGPVKKRLGPGAEEALKDRCGGNMRLLRSELEKLSSYVEGSIIEVKHVRELVGRTREEEFFELSDALHKRDLRSALEYAEAARGQGHHALQLLGAVSSIVRGLLEGSERSRHLVKGPFRMQYGEFKNDVFPKIESDAKSRKAKVPHPWAAYLGMQAAARYTKDELLRSLVACADADVALKSSGNGKLIMDRLIVSICGMSQRV